MLTKNRPYSGTAGSAIAFSSAGSFDPEGAWTAAWDFGDGGTSSAINPSHSYTSAGSYTAALTVTDQAGQAATDNAAVTITAPQPPPPPPPPGTIIFSDDFESGNLSQWDDGGQAPKHTVTANPAFVRSGVRALDIAFIGGPGIGKWFHPMGSGQDGSNPQPGYDEVYVTVDVMFGTQWTPTRNEIIHIFALHGNRIATGCRRQLFDLSCGGRTGDVVDRHLGALAGQR